VTGVGDGHPGRECRDLRGAASLRCLRTVAFASFGLYLIALLLGPSGPHMWRELGLQVLALGLIAAYTVGRSLTDPGDRRWLVPLAGWMSCMAVGNAVANGPLEASLPASARPVSTMIFIAAYPCALATVVLVHRGRWRPSGMAPLLEAGVSAVAIAAVFVAFILPTTLDATGNDPITVSTVLAFPVFDLTVVALAAAAVAMSGVGPDRISVWLGLGLVMFGSADWTFALGTARGDWVTGHPIDGVWVAGCVVVGLLAAAGRSAPRVTGPLGLASQAVPMISAATALAVLAVGTRTSLPLAGVILAVVALVGALLRLLVAHVELRSLLSSRELARTDELTGLGNRRALHEALDAAARDAGERPYALLLADLDAFKQVNDTLGHHAGDRLLVQVAGQLRAVMPPDATLIRMGGDEFAVVLGDGASRETPSQEALSQEALTALARAFATAVARIEIGSGLRVGASVGIAEAPAGESISQSELLHRADLAMYRAKRSGSMVQRYVAEPTGPTSAAAAIMVEQAPDTVEAVPSPRRP
jgi:diguanylate cyclase (GGDEF)-like protein